MKRTPFEILTQDVWAYVLGYFNDNGYMPARAEIAARFSKSRQWAHYALVELERQGKLKLLPNKHRGIVINFKQPNGKK